MNKEKDLLLKDLCARLLYWPHVKTVDDDDAYIVGLDDTEKGLFYVHILEDGDSYDTTMSVENFKPYLRPMSSMTEKEKEDMHNILSPEGTAIYENKGIATPCNHHGEWISYEFMARIVDWLNAHHFDYNGLIEKGLALEAPEGMYNETNTEKI